MALRVWCVVGEERSVCAFVRRRCWGGWAMHRSPASGMLHAGLGVLAVHCGYEGG